MSDDIESGGAEKTSKYHTAFDQFQRLNELWKLSHNHSRAGKYSEWNGDLDKIWSELAGDFDEKDDRNGKFMEFYKKLAEIGNIKPLAMIGFQKPVDGYEEKRAKQYLILLEKEIWLRRLQNNLGKGTAYADEFEDDFD